MVSIEQNTGIVHTAKLNAVIDNNKSFFLTSFHRLLGLLSQMNSSTLICLQEKVLPTNSYSSFLLFGISTGMWHQQLLMKIGHREHTKIFLDFTAHKTRSQSHLKKNYVCVLDNISVLFVQQILQYLPSKCNKFVFFVEIKKIISMILPQSKVRLNAIK